MKTPTMTLRWNIMRKNRRKNTIIAVEDQEEITALTMKKIDKGEEEEEVTAQTIEEEGDTIALQDEDPAKGP